MQPLTMSRAAECVLVDEITEFAFESTSEIKTGGSFSARPVDNCSDRT